MMCCLFPSQKSMNIHIKTFAQLTLDELYTLLRLRSAVFVVDQQCVYQDLDNQDQIAEHLLLTDANSGQLAAYARLFAPTAQATHARIGRVIVASEFRGRGLAYTLMHTAIAHLRQQAGVEVVIDIQAQTYLCAFYQSLGFSVRSPEYLEDNIPHCDMRLSPSV